MAIMFKRISILLSSDYGGITDHGVSWSAEPPLCWGNNYYGYINSNKAAIAGSASNNASSFNSMALGW